MNTKRIGLLFSILICMVGTRAFAYDIAVENADGVIIYYDYIHNSKDLAVTYKSFDGGSYGGSVVIPEEVTFMNRTRKVTAISEDAFRYCPNLTSVTIPNCVTHIGWYAFRNNIRLTSVTIGNGVTYIGDYAFDNCPNLTSVNISDIAAWCNIKFTTLYSNPLFYARHLYMNGEEVKDVIIPNSVTSIGDFVFNSCDGLNSVTIPNSVTSIGDMAFWNCSGLTSVTIGNSVTSIGIKAFENCSALTSVTIPNSVRSICDEAFKSCSGLTAVTIGNNVKSIGVEAFKSCSGLTSVTIGNSVIFIYSGAFEACSGLTSVTIPNSVTFIGEGAFSNADIPIVISLIEDPFTIYGMSKDNPTFSINTFSNATLYVPVGTIDKYKVKDGWKDFLFMVEGTGPNGGETPMNQKCDKPTISYKNGKLTFNCDTEGAVYQYSITDDDIKSGSSNEVQLGVTYRISVYATKAGYDNSETATATLCWIDLEPKTEGITEGMVQMAARAIMVKVEGGQMTVEGAEDNTIISVYSIDGVQVGTTTSRNGIAMINTAIPKDSVVIIKIGNKSFKVVMK